MSNIQLKLSISEVLDKLTILDIKHEKIKDEEKIKEIIKERDDLRKKVEYYFGDCSYLYSCLYFINKKIWEELDIIQEDKNNLNIYKSMWAKNEQRFNIKKIIDVKYNSIYKEQKNLKPKKAFICHHLGLGDMFEMSGAVRYLAFYYDEITLVCKKQYKKNVELMYKDIENIVFYDIENSEDLFFRKNKNLHSRFKAKYDNIYLAGLHGKSNFNGNSVPYDKEFYDDFGLDYEVKKVFSNTYRDEVEENKLFEEFSIKLKEKNIKEYIFYHGDSSTKNINKLQVFKNNKDILVFTPNYNFYDISHPFYDIWDKKYSNLLVPQYSIFMENSSQIHMVDSSFFSLAAMLDLRHINKKIVYLRDDKSSYINFTKFNDWEIEIS